MLQPSVWNSNSTNGTKLAAMSTVSEPQAGRPHSALVASEWEKLSQYLRAEAPLVVDGSSLDVATTVGVGRHGIRTALQKGTILSDDPNTRKRIDDSVQFLDKHLAEGNTAYG